MNSIGIAEKAGYNLPPVAPASGVYEPLKLFGEKLAYLSGTGPNIEGEETFVGKLGNELTIDDGKRAARFTALNCLSVLDNMVGLANIKKIVKVLAFIASEREFIYQPEIANEASKIFIDVLGEDVGKAARSAIGVEVLPGNIPIEIEMLVELK